MEHFLKAKSTEFINLKDKRIKNKEVLNLIQEREVIELGTQVVVPSKTGEYLLEVIEIDGDNVWWEVKGGI